MDNQTTSRRTRFRTRYRNRGCGCGCAGFFPPPWSLSASRMARPQLTCTWWFVSPVRLGGTQCTPSIR